MDSVSEACGPTRSSSYRLFGHTKGTLNTTEELVSFTRLDELGALSSSWLASEQISLHQARGRLRASLSRLKLNPVRMDVASRSKCSPGLC